MTVQPMWVQIALNAATVPAVFWDRTIGLPSSVAEEEPPTGTADSFATCSPPLPDAALLVAGAAAELLVAGALEAALDAALLAAAEVDPGAAALVAASLPELLDPHPVRTTKPIPTAPMPPAPRTVRRVNC